MTGVDVGVATGLGAVTGGESGVGEAGVAVSAGVALAAEPAAGPSEQPERTSNSATAMVGSAVQERSGRPSIRGGTSLRVTGWDI